MSEEPLKNREIIFEFYAVGPTVRVSAIDVETMTEAVTQGPKTSPDALLKREALKKLEFVMRKKGLIE